ncbi:MAG: hypothetical protein AAFY11_11360 [Cyanobacteria bacterium J06641_5]
MKDSFLRNALGSAIAAWSILVPLTPVAISQESPVPSSVPQRLARKPYTPHALAHAAYNGRLGEGLPSFSDLGMAFLLKDIRAEDLVRAAIAQGRLTEETLADRGFLRATERSLRVIVCSGCAS